MYLAGKESSNKFVEKVDCEVKRAKENKEWRREYRRRQKTRQGRRQKTGQRRGQKRRQKRNHRKDAGKKVYFRRGSQKHI